MAENVALAAPLTPVGNGAHAAPTTPLGKAAQAAPRTPGVLKSGGPRRVLTPHGKAMFAERARDAARADASGLKSPLAVDALARVMASVASAAYDQREGAAEELNTDADAVAFPDFGDCGGASPAQPSPATSDGSVRDSEPGTPVDAAAQMARAMANTPTNPLFDAGEDEIPTSDVDDGAEAAVNVPQRVPMAGHVSGTPQRVRLSDCDAGAETCQASFGSPERSPIGGGRTLVLRRANASERTELGTAAVLTPVRRSTRKTPSKMRRDDGADVDELLARCDFAYAPNPHLVSAEASCTDTDVEAPCGSGGVQSALAEAASPTAAARSRRAAKAKAAKNAGAAASAVAPRRSSRLSSRRS